MFVLDDYLLQQGQTLILLIICVSILISDNNKLTAKVLVGGALLIALLLYHGQQHYQRYACRATDPPRPAETWEPQEAGQPEDARHTDADMQEHYAPDTSIATRGHIGIFSQQRARSANALGRHSHSELINKTKQRHATLQHRQLSD